MESIRGRAFRRRAFVRARPSAHHAGPTKAFVVVFVVFWSKIDGKDAGRGIFWLGLVRQRFESRWLFSLQKRDFDGPFETRKRRANDGSRRFDKERSVGGEVARGGREQKETDIERRGGYEKFEAKVEVVRRGGEKGKRGKESEINEEE